jgi:hypothetical protein
MVRRCDQYRCGIIIILVGLFGVIVKIRQHDTFSWYPKVLDPAACHNYIIM